jgi:hypothetical protein
MTPHIFGYPAQLLLTRGGTRLDVTPALRVGPSRAFAPPTIEVDIDTIHRMLSEATAYFPLVSTQAITPDQLRFTQQDPKIARGVYRNGGWQSWVTRQGKLWVDREGNVLLIERMPKDYCLNVIQFLYENHSKDIMPERTNPLLQALRKRVLDA